MTSFRRLTLALITSVAVVATTGCATEHPRHPDPPKRTYLGPPPSAEAKKQEPRAADGVYTYASKLNYCRGAHWLATGTMSSLWRGEPIPKLVRRGTEIRVLERVRFACAGFDGRLASVRGDLARFRTDGSRHDRYVAFRDVYASQTYDEYAKREAAARTEREMTLVPIPASIRASGYEGGLQSTIDSQGMKTLAVACDVSKALRFIDEAKRSSASRIYHAERDEAYSAMANVGNCRSRDKAARANGDAVLLFAQAERRLGMPGASREDAELAAATYLDCDARHGYAKVDATYCRSRIRDTRELAR